MESILKRKNVSSPVRLDKNEFHADKYTVGSLFAGVGGICLGFKKAGFNLLWANELDKNACKTYRENFKHKLVESDINDLSPKKFEKVDVLTSGFPCQAFSIAGYRKGFEDHRGNLFFQTMRFVNELKPKVVFLENVKNLVGHDDGKTFGIIRDTLKKSGYSVLTKVLNSMEYGNVPQNRERIYIIGFRDEALYDDFFNRNGGICSSNFSFPEKIKLTKMIQDILDKKVADNFYYTNSQYYEKFKEIKWRKDTVYQWRRVYVRENKSNVCPTLTANMGTGGHNVPLIKDDKDIRKLTPRECFRLQGFTDSFKFPENMALSHLYKQAGNSVSVSVIERIAKQIKKALNTKEDLKGIKEFSDNVKDCAFC